MRVASQADAGDLDSPVFKLLKAATASQVFPLKGLFPTSYRQALALLDALEDALPRIK